MTLLSSVSKAGRDVRDARRKPAQPLHSLGWLRWQSTANAALGIGSPGCFQPWHCRKIPTLYSDPIQVGFILQLQNTSEKESKLISGVKEKWRGSWF